MTINFENYSNFFVSFTYDDETTDYYTGGDMNEGYTLKEAADFIAENLSHSLSIVSADITDALTGEVVAILEPEEADLSEEWYDYRDDYDEVGFNPYMGCYDFDC